MKNNRTLAITIGAIVLAIIAVVALVVTIVTRTGSDSADTAAQNTDSQAESEDTGEHAGDKGWVGRESDLYGRSVKIPAEEAGIPLGKAESYDSTQCETTSEPQATIQRTHDVDTLWSATQGPSAVTPEGVTEGYANSAEGAMLAAWNWTIVLFHGGPEGLATIRDHIIGGDEVVDESDDSPNGVDDRYSDWAAPDAYRITSCEPDHVIGDLAIPMPVNDQGESDRPVWASIRSSLTRENGVWKMDFETKQGNEGDIYSLEGWTKWQL